MPQFLGLPLEIRDYIYTADLDPPNSIMPPSSPLEAGERKRGANRRLPCGGYFENCNMYSLQPLSKCRSALLLANHQIHAEFTAVIERQKRLGKLCYKLDCMIVDQELIYPTWLSVSALSSRLNRVEVDIRIVGTGDKSKRSKWHHGHEGPSPLVWSLFALINRFLTRGPDFLAPISPQEQQIRIGELAINVISPLPVCLNGFATNDESDYDDAKEVLARMNAHMFLLINKISLTEWEGQIMYDRVEVIRFRLNGIDQMIYELRTMQTKGSGNSYIVRYCEILMDKNMSKDILTIYSHCGIRSEMDFGWLQTEGRLPNWTTS